MSLKPLEENREHRRRCTSRAVAEIIRMRLARGNLRQTPTARASGISRSHIQSLLRADRQISLFNFLELSTALAFEDPCQFLRGVLVRREDERIREACRAEKPNARGGLIDSGKII